MPSRSRNGSPVRSAATRCLTSAELRRCERAQQPAVDQHEPGEVAVARAPLEVPRRVGDRRRRAQRVAAEDHLAPAAASALHHRAQVLERQLQPPVARERRGGRHEPAAPEVVLERRVRVAALEAAVVLERLRAPVVGPHLQPLHALDDLRPDEREVAGAALRAGDEDQHALRRRRAEALVAHAVIARRPRPGGAAHAHHRPCRGERRQQQQRQDGEEGGSHGRARYCLRTCRRQTTKATIAATVSPAATGPATEMTFSATSPSA